MMATSLALIGPDTLVAVKVSYNDANRRFKLPLRDLGARSFPQKLRLLLSIPSDADVVFERYSDSAACYVCLDSDNPAIYKQLYRAAKAKLKLRIRARAINQPSRATSESTPELPPKLVLETTQEPSAPVRKEPLPRYSYLDTVLSPLLPSLAPLTPTPVDQLPAVPAPASESRADPALCLAPTSTEEPSKANVNALNKPSPRPFGVSQNPCYPTLFPRSEMAGTEFYIDCNNCGQSIPNEHYHCSTCDDGDYDLCQACVDDGISCPGEDHWLIKRFVKNGIVTNSITETVAPRPIRADEESRRGATVPESLPPSDLESVPPPASEAPKPAPKIEERSCNTCFLQIDEANMVTCVNCTNYDLCISCLLKDSHGHHPAHTFSLLRDRDFCLKNLVLSRCRPGRHHHHAAICDDCDKRIMGVRYKCLTCPDWDYCWDCFKKASQNHPGHRFVPIYEAIAEPPVHQETHYGIFCDGPLCKNQSSFYITGVRYKCAVCYDTDFCAACEAIPTNDHNPTHPLIKFKTPVRNVLVTTYSENGVGGAPIAMGDPPAPVPNAPSDVTIGADLGERLPGEVSVAKDEIPEVSEPATKDDEDEPPHSPQLASGDDLPELTMITTSVHESGFQASFIRDTIPDGTKFPPSHVFQQTWTLYNPGPLAWIPGCSVRFVGGDSMFNVDTDRPSSVHTITEAMESNELSAPVSLGESANFTVTLKTPLREGTAISYWRLKLPDGTPFGHKLWCAVQVQAEPTSEPLAEGILETKETQTQSLPTDIEAEVEPMLTESEMIFPKLEKESPIIATPAPPPLSNTDEQEVLEDVESLTLDDNTDGGFLTDEEYDILDASDQEFFDIKHS